MNNPKAKNLALKDIVIDPGIQPRDSIDAATVDEYAAAIEGGAVMPPAVIFDTGVSRYLAGGFQRHAAHLQLGKRSLACLVYEGTYEDAWIFARGDNKHGKHFTNSEKNRIVREMLESPLTSNWTDRRIALHVGVSHTFVRQIRPIAVETDSTAQARISVDGRQIHVPKSTAPAPEEHPDFSDADPVDEPYEHIGSIPDEQLPPHETEADKVPSAPAPKPPESSEAARAPVKPPTLAERAATAPVVHDTMPAAPPVAEAAPEENDLTDEEWLLAIPLYRFLVSGGDAALLLRADALAWRTLTQGKAFSQFKHAADRACNFKGKQTPFSYIVFQASRLPHPREWGGCVKCRAKTCSICNYSGYTLQGGLTVEQLEARP